jgi:hypothetical protein
LLVKKSENCLKVENMKRKPGKWNSFEAYAVKFRNYRPQRSREDRVIKVLFGADQLDKW